MGFGCGENRQRQELAGRVCAFPTRRPIRRAKDGAPERFWLVEESGRLLPQTISHLSQIARKGGPPGLVALHPP